MHIEKNYYILNERKRNYEFHQRNMTLVSKRKDAIVES